MVKVRNPLRVIAYYFCGALFFGGSLLLNLLAALLLLLPFRRALKMPARRVFRFLFRLYLVILRVLGICRFNFDDLNRGSGNPRVWVMNHQTIIDGVYLVALIENGTCIYKQAIASNPLYGFVARLLDYLPNEGGPDMIRMAVERVENGENVIIFPEGTRSVKMDVSRMKGGFALIAKRAAVPIEVLWLDTPYDFLACNRSIWVLPRLPADVRIRRIAVLTPEEGEGANQLCQRVASVYEKHNNA